MSDSRIYYKSGYKYQLDCICKFQTDIYPERNVSTEYVVLDEDGLLTVFSGYAWDGPSGITFDTKTFMRGSLAHDALYELMRKQLISCDNKQKADKLLKKICLEDGMCPMRAWWVYAAVDKFGRGSTLPENRKKVHVAPKER